MKHKVSLFELRRKSMKTDITWSEFFHRGNTTAKFPNGGNTTTEQKLLLEITDNSKELGNEHLNQGSEKES